jgi:hypothetical protein
MVIKIKIEVFPSRESEELERIETLLIKILNAVKPPTFGIVFGKERKS